MIRWVLFFLLVSILAGLLGFTGISQASASIAKIIFFVFVALFGVALLVFIMGMRQK
jgi:uncharacterized membrane protein YtjA (UPF0391 family)